MDMGRSIHKLKALEVERWSKKPKKGDSGAPILAYGDGGGLWLYVAPPKASSWIFRYSAPSPFIGKDGKAREAGTQREMGLGSYPTVTLEDAREFATAMRKVRSDGRDPILDRDAVRAANKLEQAKAISFKAAAGQYIEAHAASWKNKKHAAQWTSTLETYAYPEMGDIPVGAVDVTFVTKVLEPIWSKKPETAARVRGRIEAVLDWAKVRGYRTGENPARWKGHLENILPARGRVRKVKHHPALPYADLPAFLADLRIKEGVTSEALEFTILTAARTDETIRSEWSEIDFANALWKVPEGRMKKSREHWVPLSKRALSLLRARHKATGGHGYVFPGAKGGKPLSNMAMLEQLRGMRPGFTVHGFRSTFRDWAGETTAFPREVIEHALAHQLKDKAEAAYARGTLLEKRRKLMDAWASYCAQPKTIAANVTPMRKAKA